MVDIAWYEFDDDMGDAGLPGTGLTAGQVLDITTRLTDLEALTPPTVINDLTDVDTVTDAPAVGDFLQWDGTNWVPYTPVAIDVVSDLGFAIGDGSTVIAAGNKFGFKVSFAGTITAATMAPDVSTTTVVDVWASTSFPPTNANSITAAAPLTITASAAPVVDTILTGWTVAFAANTWFFFNVDSNNNAKWLGMDLKITREVGP